MMIDAARPKHRYVALDSLRGVCACMVVLLHFKTQSHLSYVPVVRNGFMFVDFFFVLSGFVIGSSYGTRLAEGFSIGRFMWLRLGRVYPLHFFVLMVFLAFELFFLLAMPDGGNRQPFVGQTSIENLSYSFLLVQIFFGSESGWNPPSWSIAAEVWTYFIFAILLRYAFRWLMPLCIAIALVAPLIISQLTDRYINVFHEGAVLRCMFGFSLGIIGWRLADRVARLELGRRASDLMELAVVAAIVLLVSIAKMGPLSLLTPFLFFVAVLIFSREGGLISRLLLRPPFVLLGTLSYSIYMVHWFLRFRFINGLSLVEELTGLDVVHSVGGSNSVGGGVWFSDAMTLLFLAFVILCSWFTYRFIEMPGQRFVRRWPRNEPVAAPLPAAPGAP